MKSDQKKSSPAQGAELIRIFKAHLEKNMKRHKGPSGRRCKQNSKPVLKNSEVEETLLRLSEQTIRKLQAEVGVCHREGLQLRHYGMELISAP